MEDSGDSWLEDCRLEVHRSGAEVGGQVALEHVAEGGVAPLAALASQPELHNRPPPKRQKGPSRDSPQGMPQSCMDMLTHQLVTPVTRYLRTLITLLSIGFFFIEGNHQIL